MTLQDVWRRLFSRKYSAILEGEVARLRAENRALLNSILGIAGVPPITVGELDAAPAPGGRRVVAETETAQRVMTPGSTVSRAGLKNAANVAAPTRRRSWHQVYRMLEIDSARKKEAV